MKRESSQRVIGRAFVLLLTSLAPLASVTAVIPI
jgi:hypothetical protein